jgi:hypothetical protein
MLTIRDRAFDIASAEFGGILTEDEDLGWNLRWYFEFDATERMYAGEMWSPRLYAESVEVMLPALAELSGTRVEMPVMDEDGEHYFFLYVFEHEPVWDVTLTFGPWKADEIGIHLRAQADIGWDEDYGSDVPLELACDARFDGFNVWHRDEAVARKALAAYCDPSILVATPANVGLNFLLGR